MHVKKVDRDAARAWLKDLGEDPTPEPEPLPETVGLEYGALNSRRFQMPKEFIHEPLAQWVTPARKYVESRGITAPQIAKWSLGYAVDGKLAGRIVIPTTTRLGQVCGYMARSFTNARKRYLYPAASERPNLDAMFGEFHWPASTARRGHSVVVTEGALNALAVERAVPGAFLAALGGRHVRPMHMGKIASFGHVTILTDPDAAGDAVALELQSLLGRHSEVRRVRLPEDQDANDMDASELARRLS